jgi:hypothetical protein
MCGLWETGAWEIVNYDFEHRYSQKAVPSHLCDAGEVFFAPTTPFARLLL